MRARKSILLAVAFAALLLVIAAAAFAVWRNARNAQERVAALHTAHMRAGTVLNEIRANVYLIGILTRDYLLDSNPAHAAQYQQQFAGIRDSTEESFRVLEASRPNREQRAALSHLREELNAYWDLTDVMLGRSPDGRPLERAGILRQRLRRRQEVFALAAQVERLITANFVQEQRRITTADQDFRSSVGLTTAVALLCGFGIAGISLFRMLTLERQSLAAESELRRLSTEIRTAQEQERKYLSRELHDQVGQMLTGLRMELTSIARIYGDSEGEVSSRITRAKGTVEQTLRIVRNIAMLLRPSMLDDLGLSPALAWLIKEISRSSDMEIHSEIDPRVNSVPDSHRTCVYRVVQEALTNASNHSGARRVDVRLEEADGWVIGKIIDDGCGFEREHARAGGLGLLGMDERVKELGGSIRVVSSPGRGTRVEFRLPFPPATEVPGDTHPDRGRSRDRSDRVEASA